LIIAGVDEVGRGALAGPVVTAAVILDPAFDLTLTDSKQLSPLQRDLLFDALYESKSIIQIHFLSHRYIDRYDILYASLRSMTHAIHQLSTTPDYVYVDGNRCPSVMNAIKVESIVKGDQKRADIAAASIIAKVSRDRLMRQLDRVYPGYGFCQHKGYATKSHYDALFKYGASPIHRLSFNLAKQGVLF
tara:strand:+ start:81 stop:647 length:567 start_codon:yes stop_codon:yes gene_type:complete